MNIPILETARLTLREPRLEDFERYAALGTDPEFMRFMTDGAIRNEEESWSGLLRMAGSWLIVGFGTWVVVEKSSGHYAGIVSFIERRRDRGAELRGVPEMGWAIDPALAGRGYATEAVGAAIAWGQQHFGSVRVIALINDENFASIRVAEKCGFREFKRDLSAGRPRIYFDRVL